MMGETALAIIVLFVIVALAITLQYVRRTHLYMTEVRAWQAKQFEHISDHERRIGLIEDRIAEADETMPFEEAA